jgi:hypothetical protein
MSFLPFSTQKSLLHEVSSHKHKVEDAIHELPAFLRDFIAKYGVEGALELTYYLTKDYTPQYVFDELKGTALCLRTVNHATVWS